MTTILKHELIAQIDTVLDEATWGIANERLAGNIVKEEFWKGQAAVASYLKTWVRLHKTPVAESQERK